MKNDLIELYSDYHDVFNSAPDPHNQFDELFRSFIFHFFSQWRLKVYANGSRRLSESSARSEDCEKLRTKISASEENSGAI